ncbi:1,2-phenylacetyl-CoA epoxidase subunit PaaC [Ramlibacter sp. WS9]|uniref:1,2-phenylacetyl-CoA epoxidase subunit PaaC n=1 Tax=Ramlibacter sp. WS9 TaxID=1882741 RepID=UPI001143F35D|nr:1,2-phenylacetyl-CoA epoxidase subunit PaaC [Ramlibacter sp. WS9]ROZ77730.1 phenylacetate-CoA oxygenase subunit PaaI [Ramlibacter sp. WS9]
MEDNKAPALAPVDYLLHLADNALVLGQRNAEWCGHGPVLEEDIAMANIGLDLIGQARMLYQHAATLIGGDATEDRLAYFRDAAEFRNYTLLELPHHGPLAGTAASDRDYATTITRNFFYSTLMLLLWEALQQSKDPQLAAIAGKALKEMRYHVRHSRDWLVRLGDGTDESHRRMQAAVDHLLPYTQEFWGPSPVEARAVASGTGVDTRLLRESWDRTVDDALAEATLRKPAAGGYLTRGKDGQHSEHLSYLLAEIQGLARQHPEATW